MADKYHSDTQEKIELVNYSPGLQNSGDLEVGTHTIVPTSRPEIASAQYSVVLTLPKSTNAKLEVVRIACRLSVNIASLGTATRVCCSVRVDVDDSDHELFSEEWTSIGAKLDTVDTYSGSKAAIFNLLKDGSAHTFYFLFWADVSNQAMIDVVQLWEAVGTNSVLYSFPVIMKLTHTGWLSFSWMPSREGTGASGSLISRLNWNGVSHNSPVVSVTGVNATPSSPFSTLSYDSVELRMCGAETTDLKYIINVAFLLRNEQ
jgi:hypothetical protein